MQEQAHHLGELTRHPGWAILVDYLDTLTRGSKLAVLNGNVADFDKYKQVTGELIGIQKALDAPAQVARLVDAELGRRADNEPDAA